MIDSFFKKVSVYSFLGSLGLAGSLSLLGYAPFSLGVALGTFWMFLNLYFLLRLVDLSLSSIKDQKAKGKVTMYSMIKFPVLYLAGFWVLKARMFSIMGIVSGLTICLLVFSVMWVAYNLDSSRFEASAS